MVQPKSEPEYKPQIEEIILNLPEGHRVVIGHVKDTAWGIYRLDENCYQLTGSAYVKEKPEHVLILENLSNDLLNSEYKTQVPGTFAKWLDALVKQSANMPDTLLGMPIVYSDWSVKNIKPELYGDDGFPIRLGDLSEWSNVPVPPHDPNQPTHYEKANWDNMTQTEWERPAEDQDDETSQP